MGENMWKNYNKRLIFLAVLFIFVLLVGLVVGFDPPRVILSLFLLILIIITFVQSKKDNE